MRRVVVIASLSLVSCTGKVTTDATNVTTTTTVVDAAATTRCHMRGQLPDPTCTPGETNPVVTQANISTTICASGWTSTVRPPASYTGALKRRQMIDYGSGGPPSAYEEDHLIPLALGGNPTDPRNLWPQPGGSPNPKDAVEDAARTAVCEGRMSLSQAQRAIASDWVSFGRQLGVPTASSTRLSPSD